MRGRDKKKAKAKPTEAEASVAGLLGNRLVSDYGEPCRAAPHPRNKGYPVKTRRPLAARCACRPLRASAAT